MTNTHPANGKYQWRPDADRLLMDIVLQNMPPEVSYAGNNSKGKALFYSYNNRILREFIYKVTTSEHFHH